MQDICGSNPPFFTGTCDSNYSWVWHHRRSNMCVGCFEISISAIVNYVQNIGIIGAFCLPGGTC